MIVTQATAMDVRKNLGETLNGVQYQHNPVVITKGGKPVAAMVDIELFNRMRLLKTEFEQMSGELALAFKGVKQDTVQDLVDEAVKSSRRSK